MKRILPIILFITLLGACRGTEFVPSPAKLVVEGWIEDGGAPYIYLTTSLSPSSTPQQVSTLNKYIYTKATVTISDGERSEVLIGLASKHYYPPFVYTGHMKGQAGKTYTITVESSEFHATASATIPPSRQLDKLEVIPFGEDPDQRLLQARFHDNPATRDFYQCFVQIEKTDSTFVSSGLTLVDDSVTPQEVVLTVRPGSSVARSERRYAFRRGETIRLKFRTMEEPMYQVWKYIGEQNAFSAVPFFVLDGNLPGNVEGALGYFAGYGCSNYEVTIP